MNHRCHEYNPNLERASTMAPRSYNQNPAAWPLHRPLAIRKAQMLSDPARTRNTQDNQIGITHVPI